MENAKRVGLGGRGWLLIVYQFIAFVAYTVFTNYPLNILASLYDSTNGNTKVSLIYTAGAIVSVVVQLIFSVFIGKIKSIKKVSIILGAISIILGFCIALIPMYGANPVWAVCYFLVNVFVIMWATFSIGILVGQWFPRRKGTVMGIATIAFPVANAIIGAFAAMVFPENSEPTVFKAFLPFLILTIIGWLIGLMGLKDYPEQCGAYRDNDKTLTPEIANRMVMEEIENKKTSCWGIGHVLTNRDFWFAAVPMGTLLMFSVGMMTQTNVILSQYEEINFAATMLMIAICGVIGSYVLGILDTRFGTKKSILIATCIMILAGVLGIIPNSTTLRLALVCLGLFMGASSNYTVSLAAQYWRREDFGSVFATVNPICNIIAQMGPVVIAMLGAVGIAAGVGSKYIFVVTLVMAVISLVLMLLFSPNHIKVVDDRYRTRAGKPLDDALVGRK